MRLRVLVTVPTLIVSTAVPSVETVVGAHHGGAGDTLVRTTILAPLSPVYTSNLLEFLSLVAVSVDVARAKLLAPFWTAVDWPSLPVVTQVSASTPFVQALWFAHPDIHLHQDQFTFHYHSRGSPALLAVVALQTVLIPP